MVGTYTGKHISNSQTSLVKELRSVCLTTHYSQTVTLSPDLEPIYEVEVEGATAKHVMQSKRV